MNFRRSWGYLLVLVILVLWNKSVLSGGFANLDAGAVRVGMLAVVAKAEDATAIFHNPAGLAEQKGDHFYISVTNGFLHARFRLLQEDGTYTHKIAPDKYFGGVPFIGYTNDLNSDRFSFGIAGYFPNLYAAYLPEDEPTKNHLLEGYFVNLYLTPVIAYKVSDRLSIGGGLSYIYGRLYKKWLEKRFNEAKTAINFDGSSWCWNAGILYKPIEKLQLGLSYFSQTKMDMDGELSFKNMNLDAKTAIPIPASVRVGINWRISPRLESGLDYSWWNYSIFQYQKIEYGPFKEKLPKLYSNSANIGWGLEYKYSTLWTFRWGAYLDQSPIPDKTFSVDNPTSDIRGVGFGVDHRLGANTLLSFGYLLTAYVDRDVKNSITEPKTNVKSHAILHEIAFGFDYKF